MPNPTASPSSSPLSLDDALKAVTGATAAPLSLDDALAKVTAQPAPQPVQAAPQPTQSSYGAITMRLAAAAVPVVRDAVMGVATSPTLPASLGTAARVGTTTAGVVHGAVTLNPAEVLAASKAGWAAGKGGYFLGKGVQAVAEPVASALEKAAPYAQTLSTLSGAQGVLDLAQMANPKRTDIGFLGVGKSLTANDLNMTPEQFAAYEKDHPALINMLASKAADEIKALVNQGLSLGNAVRTYYNSKIQGVR